MIEGYLQGLLDAIAASPIVRASSVTMDRRTPHAGLIRGELDLVDGSRLYFRELVEGRTAIVRLMYSYHYQAADASLILRYDDTPHYPGIATFPHHKHAGSETNVVAADLPDLPRVLREIESIHPLPS